MIHFKVYLSFQIMSNVWLFFFAGHEVSIFVQYEIIINSHHCLQTTATTLSWVLYYFAKHPEFQQTAREEVDAVLGKGPANAGKIQFAYYFNT
jgi:hypothetical protein